MIKEVLGSLTSFHFRCGCVKVLQDGRIVAAVVPGAVATFLRKEPPDAPPSSCAASFVLLRQWLIFFFSFAPPSLLCCSLWFC